MKGLRGRQGLINGGEGETIGDTTRRTRTGRERYRKGVSTLEGSFTADEGGGCACSVRTIVKITQRKGA